MRHVRQKEKEAGIQPDPALDAFVKGQLMHGRKETLSTEFILRVLGLDVSHSGYFAWSVNACFLAEIEFPEKPT